MLIWGQAPLFNTCHETLRRQVCSISTTVDEVSRSPQKVRTQNVEKRALSSNQHSAAFSNSSFF